ncbi:MAG TPA: hypothetical protein VI756_22085 [Blastocatellia bacterium]
MMTSTLPANPSLENLRKQAKSLRSAWQAGQLGALRRIVVAHPRFQAATEADLRAAKPRLADCQLVVARENGFESWPRLKVAVVSTSRGLPDEFILTACLCHDDPHFDHRSFHVRANEILAANPWLASANIWSAATAGNAAAVKTFLDADPDLINQAGPESWTPLICACYSRVKPVEPAHSTLEVVKLLLDHGADPNSYTIKGNADERLDQTGRRFTALTGLFGGGSTGLANQPMHPQWREVAQLLLECGADPADEQAIINNPKASLEILLRHGLKPTAMARTNARGNSPGITLMGRALGRAAMSNDAGLVKLLLEYGARTEERLNGKTPWEQATTRGHMEVAKILADAGAPTVRLNDVDQFVSLCLAGNGPGVRAMLNNAPGLIERAPRNMVQRAVGTERKEAVKLALDLGFDPNFIDDNAAIHHAGVLAKNEEILRLLLEGGASVKLREPWYDSTGIGWAEFFEHPELRDRLLNEEEICLFDALDYGRLDRVGDILARDPDALERPFAKCLSREPNPQDWQTPLVRMVDQGKTEAVRALLDCGADATAHHPDGRSVLQLARDKGFKEIAELVERQGVKF